MALIVQKFGGTSVGSVDRIQKLACRVLDAQAKGDDLVLVISAMSGETNRLIHLATQINPVPYSREYDMLIASGEQAAIGLVALALNTEAEKRGLLAKNGWRARPLLGFQIGIVTNQVFSKARIQHIDTRLLRQEIDQKVIPVIAGFQGVDSENNITTLGRGGSDTSAVAIAAALKADDCEIYTDVEGVYTTDPRLCSEARKIDKISYEEMMELASLGAKVLQIRSVELAAKYNIPIHVRSSFVLEEGTRVVSSDNLGPRLEQVVVAGVAADRGQSKITLQNLPSQPGVAALIFSTLSEASIVVDVIVMDAPSQGRITLSFTVGEGDSLAAKRMISQLQQERYPEVRIVEENELAKVSIVGVGMQHHPGVASKMFALLAEESIDIKLITTSEIKVSCLIENDRVEDAVKVLHRGFELAKLD